MLTAEVTMPEPNVTAKDIEQALKKQLKTLQGDMQKLHKVLLEQIKGAVREELRQVLEIEDQPRSRGSVDIREEFDKTTSTKKIQKPGKSISPFKNRNARLNDADELDPANRREPVMSMSSAVKAIMAREKAKLAEQTGGQTNSGADTSAADHLSVRSLQQYAEETVIDTNNPDPSSTKDSARSSLSLETGSSAVVPDVTAPSIGANEPLLPVPNEIISAEAARQSLQDAIPFDWTTCLFDPKFEGAIVCLVMLNAIWIGAELEYKLSVSEVRPHFFNWINILFCATFTSELLFRICVLRSGFFDPRTANCVWNYFDFVLVLSQLLELIFECVDVHKNVNVSWLRIFRVLRIVRLTRIVRAVRFIEGLRTLVKCVFRGMQATGWISLFLVLQVYTCSLAFAELVYYELGMHPTDHSERGDLRMMFGTLRNTMGTLIKSVAGGILWDNALSPLMDISPPLGIAFVTYVCFTVFVILNVIVGFYVNTSTICSDEDSKKNLRDHVADIFVHDGDTYLENVNEDVFTERVHSPEMLSYFQSIDLHVDEAQGLFQLLDLDNNGTLDPIECVSALVRMQGTAKALDLRVMMFMVAKQHEWNTEHITILEEKIINLHKSLSASQEQKDATVDTVANEAAGQ